VRCLLEKRQTTGDVAKSTTVIDARGCMRNVPASADSAVEEKGGVALRARGDRAVEISYRPRAVRPRALLRAVQLLDGARAGDRHVLKAGVEGGQTTLVGNRAAAIEHLMGAITDAQSTRHGDFSSQRRLAGAAMNDPAFARLGEAWLEARGRKRQGLMEAVREASGGRYLEVEPQQGASRLILGAVGDGYSLYGSGWKSMAVGGLFEDMPDFEYARWAAQAYREAYRTGEPIFEEVSATVRLLRRGRLRLTYRRVILPVGSGEHPTRLLGATLDQRVTQLPLGADDEFGDVLQ
jgi:hypothetical protein